MEMIMETLQQVCDWLYSVAPEMCAPHTPILDDDKNHYLVRISDNYTTVDFDSAFDGAVVECAVRYLALQRGYGIRMDVEQKTSHCWAFVEGRDVYKRFADAEHDVPCIALANALKEALEQKRRV